MNGVLNSEVTLFQSDKHSNQEHISLETSNNFSDLVPFYVTVESVSTLGVNSYIQLNPMAASNNSINAVTISAMEIFSHNTRVNAFGTGPSCTPTVTFFNSIHEAYVC